MDVLAKLRMAVAKMCFTDGGQAGTRGNGLSLVYPSWSSPTEYPRGAITIDKEPVLPWQPQFIVITSLHQMYRMNSPLGQGAVSKLVVPFSGTLHLQKEHIHLGVTP